MTAPLQPLELLRVLGDHSVDFVVIGGFAMAAHGYVRATKDLDIFPDPSDANLLVLQGALRVLEAEPGELDAFRPNELPVQLDLAGLRGGGNWILSTRFGRLDLMQDLAGVADYQTLREGAVRYQIPGLAFEPLFVGYEELIAMKRAAGRDQDLLDIAALETARRDA